MQLRYIPAFIVLLAAAITSIINIVNNVDLLTGLKRLLLAIIIFYIIGLIARVLLNRVTSPKLKNQKTEEIQREELQSEKE